MNQDQVNDRLMNSVQKLSESITDLKVDIAEIHSDVKRVSSAFEAYSKATDQRFEPLQKRHTQIETLIAVAMWVIPSSVIAAVTKLLLP